MISKDDEIKKLKKELKIAKRKYEKNNDEKLILANLLSNINSELEDSLRNEKRFIASVSHELRTPMTSILGYGELMADTQLSSRQKRYLESITQSSHYLLSLINDLLDVAKFADKRVELNPKVVELYDILNESTTLIQSKIAEGVKFNINIPPLEYKIKVDDKRLKQIVINLLSNAAKFTYSGHIDCSVASVIECSHLRNMLEVTLHIEDTGPGIPEGFVDKLFVPFASTDKTQGTGLGLFISQELAHLMGGEITYHAVEGGGSLFVVRILVEKSIKKEIGKKLINKEVLVCSPKSSFMDSVAMELQSIGMDSFHHYDISEGGIPKLLVDVLPYAQKYDSVIFDVDICGENTAHIAKMFTLINENIKLFAWMNDDTVVDITAFDMLISKPIAYQQFILEIEKFYSTNSKESQNNIDYSELKILIVEDVEINRIYEAEMLNNFFGITCDTASNGAIALDMAKNNKYDAIFMDMRMPVMNGQEATRKIREFDTITPIICMSANVYTEDKMEAQESGMNAFIEKPLEKVDIENQLLKLINHKFIYKNENLLSILVDTALIHLRKNFDEETAIHLFDIAMISIYDSLKSVHKHNEENNSLMLLDDFHALKGILSNLGLSELAEEANRLQFGAKEGKLEELKSLQEHLVTTLRQLLEYK